jgi:hypothetical protein
MYFDCIHGVSGATRAFKMDNMKQEGMLNFLFGSTLKRRHYAR